MTIRDITLDFPSSLFSTTLLWSANLCLFIILFIALRHADWQRLRESESLHILLGMTVLVLLLWQIKAEMANGLHLHLLGSSILCLMFRWRFALLSMTLVMVMDTFYTSTDLIGLGVNVLFSGLLPITACYLFALLVRHKLPTHFFIYVFISCFLGAGLAVFITALASTALLLVASPLTSLQLLPDYLLASLMMMFPEAFVTGMLMTLFIVYKPQWVSTFYDEVYIRGK